jgi:hypothetical protein
MIVATRGSREATGFYTRKDRSGDRTSRAGAHPRRVYAVPAVGFAPKMTFFPILWARPLSTEEGKRTIGREQDGEAGKRLA